MVKYLCKLGGAGSQNAWRNWQAAIELILEEMKLSKDERVAFWSGRVARAYKIED